MIMVCSLSCVPDHRKDRARQGRGMPKVGGDNKELPHFNIDALAKVMFFVCIHLWIGVPSEHIKANRGFKWEFNKTWYLGFIIAICRLDGAQLFCIIVLCLGKGMIK